MATYYQDSVKQIDAADNVLRRFYKKIGKTSDGEVTVDMIEQKGGTKKDLALWMLKFLNLTVDCLKLVQSGCAEVDSLTKETKDAYKDLASIQQKLVSCKDKEIRALQTGVQQTLKWLRTRAEI